MYKRLAILSLLALNTCYAKELTSYQEAVDALANGQPIRYFLDWDACKVTNPNGTGNVANFSSFYQPENVNVHKEGYLVSQGTAYTHLIRKFPELGATNQYYVYVFTKTGTLHVMNRFLDPVTFAEKAKPIEADCQLGVGFKVFA